MDLDRFPSCSVGVMRRRGVVNLLRMGHCAPAVMQTLLEASQSEGRWVVTLTAGLPGGIGSTGGECGGLTAPLVFLGLRYGRDDVMEGVPRVLYAGHDLLRRFTERAGTTQCRQILGDARLPFQCIGVVRQASPMCAECLDASIEDALSADSGAAYRELWAHWRERGFHCADAVFAELDGAPPSGALADAVTAFMGGTLLTGMTCSALTAGVMALGRAVSETEDSYWRVARMIATMAAGGNAFADDLNAFNRVMNLGRDLATWFESEFGSTQCRALTGADFATAEGTRVYIGRDGTSECQRLARLTAAHVAEMIAASTIEAPEQQFRPDQE